MCSLSLRRNAVLALLAAWLTACVRAEAAPRCEHAQGPSLSPAVLAASPGWLDRESLSADEPLTLHDIQWVLKTGNEDSEVIAPREVHAFSLGRWECALGEERRADVFEAPRLTIARQRRLVCTHASGITVQTELACGYEAPSRAAQGAPSSAGRHTELAFADAPVLTWSCRTAKVERLQVRSDSTDHELCVIEGSAIGRCSDGT